MTRRCSVKPRELRGEHTVADSGEPPWKGMPKFARLVRPLLESFYQNDQPTLALLVNYELVHGVTSTVGEYQRLGESVFGRGEFGAERRKK
jgi:hypothetical protein